MGRGPALTDKEQSDIRQLTSEGVRPFTIAKRVKRSRNAVRRVLGRNPDAPPRVSRAGRPRKLFPDVTEKVLSGSKEGSFSARELRNFFELPVSVRLVRKLVRDAAGDWPAGCVGKCWNERAEADGEAGAEPAEQAGQSNDGECETQKMKVSFRGDIRRLWFSAEGGISELSMVLAGMFSPDECGGEGALAVADFRLRYMDDEGDWVRLSSDTELSHAIENAGDGLLRLEMVPVVRLPANGTGVQSLPALTGLSVTPATPAVEMHPTAGVSDEGACIFTT